MLAFEMQVCTNSNRNCFTSIAKYCAGRERHRAWRPGQQVRSAQLPRPAEACWKRALHKTRMSAGGCACTQTSTNTYTNTHTQTHTHAHTHTHNVTYACTHARTHARTHASTHTRTHTRTHARRHARTQVCAHDHTQPTHTCTHTNNS